MTFSGVDSLVGEDCGLAFFLLGESDDEVSSRLVSDEETLQQFKHARNRREKSFVVGVDDVVAAAVVVGFLPDDDLGSSSSTLPIMGVVVVADLDSARAPRPVLLLSLRPFVIDDDDDLEPFSVLSESSRAPSSSLEFLLLLVLRRVARDDVRVGMCKNDRRFRGALSDL